MFMMSRKWRKSATAMFLVIVMTLLMAGWGFENNWISRHHPVALKIDGSEIPYEEYYHHYQILENVLRDRLGRYGESLKPFLQQQTVESLITKRLLSTFAQELGITMSPQKVRQRVEQASSLFDGSFTPETYRNFLKARGTTAFRFEAEIKTELLRPFIYTTLAQISLPTERELRAVFQEANTGYTFHYVEIDPAHFESKVPTNDDAQLTEYFEKNKESYQKPRSVRYSFVAFRPENFLPKVELNEDDLQSFYEEWKSAYTQPKQLHVKKIFIPKDPSSSTSLHKLTEAFTKQKEEKLQSELPSDQVQKKKIENFLTRLKNGETFPQILTEIERTKFESKTTDSPPHIMDLDWVKYSDLKPEVRSAVVNLGVGEYSNLIEEPDGFSIAFVEEAKKARKKPFEEVKAEVETAYRHSEAPLYTKLEAENLLELWKTKEPEKSLAEFIRSQNQKVESSDKFLTQHEDLPGAEPGLSAKVIHLNQGDRELVQIGKETIYIVEVSEKKEPFIPVKSEVQVQLVKDFVHDQAKVIAKQFADDFLQKLRGENSLSKLSPPNEASEEEEGKVAPTLKTPPPSFTELVKKENLQMKETPSLTRSHHADIFSSPELHRAAFALTQEAPLANRAFEVRGKLYVLELTKRTPADESSYASNRKKLLGEELDRAGNRLFETLLATLRKQADIWVNPEIVSEGGHRDATPFS